SKLADAGKVDELAIEIMTQAFKLKVVTKRAILILTEHCLANERNDDFALRVYETYLSTWPDRPQRSIFAILAHHYAEQTRVDDQAQKIYHEALVDNPTDTEVVTILARAYQAADRRDEAAEQIYRQAFAVASDETKKELAKILSEIRVEANNYGDETLQFLTTMGRPKSGPLAESYDEALTSCFLAAGRRGEQAQAAYFALFEKTENSKDLNQRLVHLLSELILERGKAPSSGSLEMRVYRKLFEIEKFSTGAEIAFVLLADALEQKDEGLNLVHLSVLGFENDQDRFIKLLQQVSAEHLLQETGDFYLEHYNFELAAKAYQASYDIVLTDQIRYRLAKIHLLDNQPKRALEHLSALDDPEYSQKRLYWEAAAYQMSGSAAKAEKLFTKLTGENEIPEFLLNLRGAINLELKGELEDSLEVYSGLVGNPNFSQFDRWIQLERGIVMMKLKQLEAAQDHLEETYRLNPNSRAEQLFYSLALFFQASEHLRSDNLSLALPLFTRAVEVNRNHRLLRQVIVDILSMVGERAFFDNQLQRAAKILEVCHRILPKREETKTYLAYTYHRLDEYAKSVIFYREIPWTDSNPRLQRSHASAYMSNGQKDKAWKVLYDLAKRENLQPEDFPHLVSCFLADPDAANIRAWEKVEFAPELVGAQLVALLIHDGLNERAIELLTDLLAKNPDDLQLHWHMGKAYSSVDKRELAVHHWKQLLTLCDKAESSPGGKTRQFTEIGLAFVGAGYAKEAMQTWEQLRNLDEDNPDLPVLYAATLDLNAYKLARKDQNKMARDEWQKAMAFDQDNLEILQNCAIISFLLEDFEEATRQFQRLGKLWQKMVDNDPRKHQSMVRGMAALERVMNVMAMTKGRPEYDMSKVRAEDTIDFYQKANQFYWILSLDKRAGTAQIEREYFRLIKIFNPERHADDFMLVEESYTNLLKNPELRALLDQFVFNPTDLGAVRKRLARLPRNGEISFEQLNLPTVAPLPDFRQLKMPQAKQEELTKPLNDMLAINFRIPDWTIL
ncbi:hypothetical protein IIA79_01230, partial [bacterium]|nr:hypothetical protein [bacterium]